MNLGKKNSHFIVMLRGKGLNCMSEAAVALSKHRLEQAEQCIRSARVLRDTGDYKGAAIAHIMQFFMR